MKRKIIFKIETEIDIGDMSDETAEFWMNDGGYCLDNIIRNLSAQYKDIGPCCCNVAEAHLIN